MYWMLDVAVHASIRPEPFGLTIVEAMGCGKPMECRRGHAGREYLTDSVMPGLSMLTLRVSMAPVTIAGARFFGSRAVKSAHRLVDSADLSTELGSGIQGSRCGEVVFWQNGEWGIEFIPNSPFPIPRQRPVRLCRLIDRKRGTETISISFTGGRSKRKRRQPFLLKPRATRLRGKDPCSST